MASSVYTKQVMLGYNWFIHGRTCTEIIFTRRSLWVQSMNYKLFRIGSSLYAENPRVAAEIIRY